MYKLVKKGFDKANIISFGNMFLIGNGHLGYKGTLEEYTKEQMPSLNVVGIYDKYQNKWRESINMPNPFFAVVKSSTDSFSVLDGNYLCHQMSLNIKHAIFKRKTTYKQLDIVSERFISQTIDNLLLMKFEIHVKEDITLNIEIGTDIDIYEINGPHFPLKEITSFDSVVYFKGKTNEGKTLKQVNKYIFPQDAKINSFKDGIYNISLNGKTQKKYVFYCFSKIVEKNEKNIFINYKVKDYLIIKQEHKKAFNNKWENADVIIKGNKKAQFAIRYSIYHLLILGNKNYTHSIPARGVSGQTYKGAIFWDTEIFMLPFFTLTDPSVASSLLQYRINTLKGALRKAKQYGYKGAFYAWESQERGQDGCSKYNVTDVFTNKPVRTYFNEKQIHISADIAYGLIMYSKITNNDHLLINGGLNVIKEVCEFFISYSKLIDGKYHINDVIGPDEYHERVDDNAFTNYMMYFTIFNFIKYMDKYNYLFENSKELVDKYQDFIDKLYLPLPNSMGIIEQFKDYYKKEDVLVEEVRRRLRHPNEYWGTKNGVAHNTKVIKQADVITLLVLLGEMFTNGQKKANFEYYYKYTEHGSSLSSSMYSIIASLIGKNKIAYDMFIKSAEIDLGTNQKMFAGGIYIGGTHPASNGGSYLSLIFGMAGLTFENDKIKLYPNLPKKIKGLEFKIIYKGSKYKISIDDKNNYLMEESL